ncbi:unnamed protein product [Sphagnum compactum]
MQLEKWPPLFSPWILPRLMTLRSSFLLPKFSRERQGASSSHFKNLYHHLQIQNDAVNLSPEGRSALQNALLMSAKKFSNGPLQLLTQICVVLSALVLRAVEWRKPVEQLFELQGQGIGSNAILELLTVLPEEVIED